jgi:alkanesulfonate monooxygenase SsuD/methylene tetrahydromethanopterin reductase-like flavin-dependent oxidoreductase (luciferase family)
VKAEAAALGRHIGVFTVGVITCRPTMAEAKAYHDHCVIEQADWSAVDQLLELRNITPQTVSAKEFAQHRTNYAHGNSGVPIVGDPDHVARQLTELSQAGLEGIAVSFVNYADELPYFRAEVLPRLERTGLRLPA